MLEVFDGEMMDRELLVVVFFVFVVVCLLLYCRVSGLFYRVFCTCFSVVSGCFHRSFLLRFMVVVVSYVRAELSSFRRVRKNKISLFKIIHENDLYLISDSCSTLNISFP